MNDRWLLTIRTSGRTSNVLTKLHPLAWQMSVSFEVVIMNAIRFDLDTADVHLRHAVRKVDESLLSRLHAYRTVFDGPSD